MARQQPQPSYRRPSLHSAAGSSPDVITDADLEGYRHPSQKYGNLASYVPFAPRILSDTYSTMSCPFEMGDEPITPTRKVKATSSHRPSSDGFDDAASVASGRTGTGSGGSRASGGMGSVSSIRTESTIKPESARETAWWPGGRPPKGKISWITDDKLVTVGAGRDGRWEIFVIGTDKEGRRGVERRGWKRYLEDEGLD